MNIKLGGVKFRNEDWCCAKFWITDLIVFGYGSSAPQKFVDSNIVVDTLEY